MTTIALARDQSQAPRYTLKNQILKKSDIEEIRKEIPDFNEKDWNKELEKYAEYTKKELIFSAGLSPTNNEYQNFGILAAIDIINAINDALQRYRIDKNNITLIGSSYGGYLANLVTKNKPGAIRLVLDNSSWAKPNLSYIVGREINSPEFIYSIKNKIKLQLYVKTPWTLKDSGSNRFTGAVKEIRSFTIDQVKQMARQGASNTEYIFYHSIKDTIIAPVSEKNK